MVMFSGRVHLARWRTEPSAVALVSVVVVVRPCVLMNVRPALGLSFSISI